MNCNVRDDRDGTVLLPLFVSCQAVHCRLQLGDLKQISQDTVCLLKERSSALDPSSITRPF